MGFVAGTKLLVEFNGDDAATTYTAETGQTVTFAAGSAQLDTSQKKFGSASLSVATTGGGYVSVPDSADWNFGTGAFTIDFWVRRAANWSASTRYMIYQASGSGYIAVVYVNGNTCFIATNPDTAAYLIYLRFAWAPSDATWHHVTVVRSGNTWYIFIDGTSKALTLVAGAYDCTMPDLGGALLIGGSASYAVYGWMDSVRVVKGYALWTANFTPPASEAAYRTMLQQAILI